MAHNSSCFLGLSKCNNGQRGCCSSIGIVNRLLECSYVCFLIVCISFRPLFILLLAMIVGSNLGGYCWANVVEACTYLGFFELWLHFLGFTSLNLGLAIW
jgi:hypothetical protein